MKEIRLIASDFDSLTQSCMVIEGGTGQYAKNNDCPIARAARRAGLINVWVYPDCIEHDKRSIDIEGGPDEVERCREELLAGARYAIIHVIQ